MTKSYILFAVVFTSIFVLLSSCACTKKENQMIPNDFHLRFGAGGGFTGIWSGYFERFLRSCRHGHHRLAEHIS